MEIIALLTSMKDMGLDVGQLGTMGLIYFMLRKDLLKVIDKQFDKLIDAIQSLEKAHNARLQVLEGDLSDIKKKLE